MWCHLPNLSVHSGQARLASRDERNAMRVNALGTGELQNGAAKRTCGATRRADPLVQTLSVETILARLAWHFRERLIGRTNDRVADSTCASGVELSVEWTISSERRLTFGSFVSSKFGLGILLE